MDFYTLNVVFFIATLLSYFIIQYKTIKVDRIVSSILFVIFLCLIAFRPISSPDTIPYIKAFNSMSSYEFSFGLGRLSTGTRMEIGFMNLCKFVSLFTSSYKVFFFIVALIIVGISTLSVILIFSSMDKGLAIQYRILPAFLLFTSYYGFYYAGIVLRAGLAISFCILSYALVFKKHYVFAILFYLIALSFHNSVLVFLVIYFIYFILPAFKIRTYRIAALTIIGLYLIRFFDLFQGLLILIAKWVASLHPFFYFFRNYLAGEYLNSSFLNIQLFFMLELVYLTFCFNDNISKKFKKNLNVLLIVNIFAGLFGAFPAFRRVLDILLIVMIPALYYTVVGIPSDERISVGEKLSIRKLPFSILGLGVISAIYFLAYSRSAGY